MNEKEFTLACETKGEPIDVNSRTVMKVIKWANEQNWRIGVAPSNSTKIDGYRVGGENMHNKFVILPDGSFYRTGEEILLSISEADSEEYGSETRSELVEMIR